MFVPCSPEALHIRRLWICKEPLDYLGEPPVLVFEGCRNKFPQTGCLTATAMYAPTALEAEVQNRGVGDVDSSLLA